MFVHILMNKFILLPPGVSSWAPAGIFPEGAKPRGLTKMTKARTKIFAVFRRLKLKLFLMFNCLALTLISAVFFVELLIV